MGSIFGNQFQKTADRELFTFGGLILTDGSGNPTNSTTTLDQDGDVLLFPREIVSVTKTATGTYRATLAQPWFKFVMIDAMLYKTAAANSGFQIKQFNPKGSVVNSIPAQTVDVIYQVAGSAADLISAGFFLQLVVVNDRQ